MKSPAPSQGLAAGAAAVTVLLTAAAFWLSYEHLHDVAGGNGLTGVRAWVWPATVDLFIVAGELLILRASLQNRVDGWAIALAATGSLGSIALNVAGVGDGASRMEYVVAAVPPSAALIAFGALMRQVHDAIARAQKPAAVTTPEPPVVEADDHPIEPPAPQRYGDPVVTRPAPEVVPAGVELLPIVAPLVTTEVTIERITEKPDPVVTRPAPEVVPAGVELLPIVAPLVTTEVTIERITEKPDPVVTRPAPEVVPAGVELLPIVAPLVTTEVTIERITEKPDPVVTRPAIETEWKMLDWSSIDTPGDHQRPAELTTAVAAAEPRQVVTVPVTITPAELRKQARKLNRQLVNDTGRQVTIERLREEYGLSRREATELRRDIVGSGRS